MPIVEILWQPPILERSDMKLVLRDKQELGVPQADPYRRPLMFEMPPGNKILPFVFQHAFGTSLQGHRDAKSAGCQTKDAFRSWGGSRSHGHYDLLTSLIG